MSDARPTEPEAAEPLSIELRAKASGSYVDLRSIYFGVDALRPGRLQSGRVTVLLEKDTDFRRRASLTDAVSCQGWHVSIPRSPSMMATR